MTGEVHWSELAGRRVLVYLPSGLEEGDRLPVVYLHDAEHLSHILAESMRTLEEQFEAGTLRKAVLVGICSQDRDGEYTPWPAVGFDGAPDGFGGRGKAYLRWIAEELKPTVDSHLPTLRDSSDTAIVGVSLGGLISVYGAFVTPVFGSVVSISGSFWYPGWSLFLQQNQPKNPDTRFLLTCGRYEGRGYYTMGLDAAQCTHETAEFLSAMLPAPGQLEMRLDNGKHHDKQVSRLRVALSWVLRRD